DGGRPHECASALPFEVLRAEYAVTASLNDHGTLPRSEKVGHVCRNDDEASSRIGLQLRLVELLSHPQVPGALHNRDDFVIWMRLCQDFRTAGYLDPVDPSSPFTRIAAELGSLSAVGVVGGRELSNVLRRQRRDLAGCLSGSAGGSSQN